MLLTLTLVTCLHPHFGGLLPEAVADGRRRGPGISPSPRKRGSEGRVETHGDPGRCRQEDKRPGAHGWGRRWPFLKPDFMRPGADWRRSAEPQHGRSDALCRDARSEDRSLLGDVAVAAADDLCGYCRRIFRLGCFVLHGSNQFRGAMKRAPALAPRRRQCPKGILSPPPSVPSLRRPSATSSSSFSQSDILWLESGRGGFRNKR